MSHQKEEEKQKFIFVFFSWFFVNTVTDTHKGSTLMTTGISGNFHFYFKVCLLERQQYGYHNWWSSAFSLPTKLFYTAKVVLYSKKPSTYCKHLVYNPWDEPKVKRKISKSREILKFQNSFDQPRKVQHPNNF